MDRNCGGAFDVPRSEGGRFLVLRAGLPPIVLPAEGRREYKLAYPTICRRSFDLKGLPSLDCLQRNMEATRLRRLCARSLRALESQAGRVARAITPAGGCASIRPTMGRWPPTTCRDTDTPHCGPYGPSSYRGRVLTIKICVFLDHARAKNAWNRKTLGGGVCDHSRFRATTSGQDEWRQGG